MESAFITITNNTALEAALQLPPEAQAELFPLCALEGSVLSVASLTFPKVDEYDGDIMHFLAPESETAVVNPDYKLLKGLPVPDLKTVEAILKWLKKYPSTRGLIFAHVPNAPLVTWPLWVAVYWEQLHSIQENSTIWSSPLIWLRERCRSAKASVKSVASQVTELLTTLQWDSHVYGFFTRPNASDLALFLSRKWLGSTQEDMMLELIQDDVSASMKVFGAHTFVQLAFSQKLLYIFTMSDAEKREELYGASKWMHVTGEDLGRRKTIAFIFNLETVDPGRQHWVAAIIDVENHCILYGDSLGKAPPEALVVALNRWIAMHTKTLFRVKELPSPQQKDGYSCGVLAVAAIGHYYLPKKYSVTDEVDPDEVRLRVLKQILIRHKNNLPVIAFNQNMNSRPQTPPNVYSGTADLSLSISRMNVSDSVDEPRNSKDKDTLKRTKGSPFGPSNSPFSSPTKKKVKKAIETDEKISEEVKKTEPKKFLDLRSLMTKGNRKKFRYFVTDSDLEDGMELAESISLEEKTTPVKKVKKKIFIAKSPASNNPSRRITVGKLKSKPLKVKVPKENEQKTGRPTDSVMDQLTLPIGNHKGVAATERRWSCAGIVSGCQKAWKGRTSGRILKHAVACVKLSDHQRRIASRSLSSEAIGAVAEALNAEEEIVAASEKPDGIVNEHTSRDYFTAAGRKEHAIRLTFAIVKLICVGGIPPYLLELPEWKQFMHIAVPYFHCFSRDYLENRLIPQEAALVRQQQLEFLQTQEHLTLSFDGGATRKGESFYTLHAITPDRLIFFMEAHSGVDAEHTSRWLANMTIAAIKSVGISRWSCIVSDCAGNTKKCRRLVTEEIQTIFDVRDPCHHLNLIIQDICKHSHFQPIIRSMRRDITFFSHSNQAKVKLSVALKELGITQGLRTIGKTRFATLTTAAVALRRCLPAIRKLVDENELPTLPDDSIYTANTRLSSDFEMGLTEFIDVTLPIAKAITCLESTHSSLADVFLFCVAANVSVKKAIENPRSRYPEELISDISDILNYRHNEIFMEGPRDLHLTAFYLHPEYLKSPVLHKPNVFGPTITVPATASQTNSKETNPKSTGLSKPAIPNTLVFKRVGECLGRILHTEVLHGHSEIFVASRRTQKASVEIKKDFQSQFDNYARGLWPFEKPIRDGDTALTWWRRILISGDATVLATLAVKIFSVFPNSMADERTASNFTWINRPLRSSQHLSTITDQIHIRQYYRSDPKGNRPPIIPTVKFADLSKILPSKTSKFVPTDQKTTNSVSDDPACADSAPKAQEDILIDDPEDDEVDDEEEATWLSSSSDVKFTKSARVNIDSDINFDSPFLADLLAEDNGSASHSRVRKSEKDTKDDEVDDDFDASTMDWDFDWNTE